MHKCDVRTPGDALAYMTGCVLATVAALAMKKSRPKHEFERQISIAQHGVDWMREMNIAVSMRCAVVVRDFGGSVKAWANSYLPESERAALVVPA